MKFISRSCWTIFIVALILSSFLPAASLAASPGLNLINDPSSANNMPEINGWYFYAPASPADLLNVNLSAPNLVIRLHSSWTELGQQMLSNDPQEQARVASAWADAISKLSASGKKIYVEPFNELEQDYERRNSTGLLSLDRGLANAARFIAALQKVLPASVTLTTPAYDPQNENFETVVKFFSSLFPQINTASVHPYTLAAFKKISDHLKGKNLLFTEIGAINPSSGHPAYYDSLLIDFFCNQGFAAQMHSTPNLLAYFLFAFAPGDFNGQWNFVNPNVSKAIQNRCSEIDPNATPYPTRLPTPTNSPPALGANSEAFVSTNTCQPVSSSNSIANGDPNSNACITTGASCSYQHTIEQNYPQQYTKDPNTGENTPIEQDITSVEQEDVGTNGLYTNTESKDLSDHLNGGFVPKIRNGPFTYPNGAPSTIQKYQLTSYSYKTALNPALRGLPLAWVKYLKGQLIEDSVESLESLKCLQTSPTSLVSFNHSVSDQPVAWGIPRGGAYNCIDFDKGPTDRPITIAELAYGLTYINHYPFTFTSEGNSRFTPRPLSAKAQDLLTRYYLGGGYEQCTGKPFVPLIAGCYIFIYKNISPVARGAVDNLITVENIGRNGRPEPTPAHRSFRGAEGFWSGTEIVYNQFGNYSTGQKSPPPPSTNLCQTGSGNTDPNHRPTPTNFFAYVLNLFRKAFGGRQTAEVLVTSTFPNSGNYEAYNQYMVKNYLSKRDIDRYYKNNPCSSQGSSASTKELKTWDPGLCVEEKLLDQNLTPWKNQRL